MNSDLVILIVQIVAALGVVISVIYLGIQIHQQNEITKAQFGHSLTQRQYERYFATAKDLSLIHISEPTRPSSISYAVFCL